MKTKFFQVSSLLILSLFLSSCGFQMKGSNSVISSSQIDGAVEQMRVNAPITSQVANQLRQRFGVDRSNANAAIAINILDERLENKVIAYDNNSEPNGYEVKIALNYEIARFEDRVKEVLFSETIENLDYLFIDDGDSQSEINQVKMQQLIEQLADSLAEKVYSQAINQIGNNSENE